MGSEKDPRPCPGFGYWLFFSLDEQTKASQVDAWQFGCCSRDRLFWISCICLWHFSSPVRSVLRFTEWLLSVQTREHSTSDRVIRLNCFAKMFQTHSACQWWHQTHVFVSSSSGGRIEPFPHHHFTITQLLICCLSPRPSSCISFSGLLIDPRFHTPGLGMKGTWAWTGTWGWGWRWGRWLMCRRASRRHAAEATGEREGEQWDGEGDGH